MTRRERALIYPLLGIILLLNLMLVFGRSGGQALADFERGLDDLGPADRLILSGEEDLIVRNSEGRVAWAENAHGRAYSIGFVHVQDTIEKLMERPVYKDERDRLSEEIQAEESEWQTKYDELRQKYADITSSEDPRFAEAQAAFGTWQRQFEQWRQSASTRVNTMAVEQLRAAYREIIDAVDVVADHEQIDLVMRSIPVGEELPGEQHAQTMLDIRMRPVLRAPEGLDITPSVLEELGLSGE